jgi:hypothetical protein
MGECKQMSFSVYLLARAENAELSDRRVLLATGCDVGAGVFELKRHCEWTRLSGQVMADIGQRGIKDVLVDRIS